MNSKLIKEINNSLKGPTHITQQQQGPTRGPIIGCMPKHLALVFKSFKMGGRS
jgi:hypothetical protein